MKINSGLSRLVVTLLSSGEGLVACGAIQVF
jgi:hypothetical protein